LIKDKIKDADLVITTALVIGKKSPLLVTEEMVKPMKPDAVTVDMANIKNNFSCKVFAKILFLSCFI